MPHLHLPADHSDADLILAANVAAVVGSEDLYVAWTHALGAGAVPEIEALLREERPTGLAALLGSVLAGMLAVWHGLTHVPPQTAPRDAGALASPQARETSS
jgi:hypothetical protein